MPKKLLIDVINRGAVAFIRLDGVIDEDNQLLQAAQALSKQKVLIQLARVTRLNSLGIRDWVGWISDLESRGNQVFFIEASPGVVRQLNTIRNFAGESGLVVSFLAPYFCESCEQEKSELVYPSTVATDGEPAVAICPSCSEAMVFDDIPNAYFSFVKGHLREVDPEVRASVDKFQEAQVTEAVPATGDSTP